MVLAIAFLLLVSLVVSAALAGAATYLSGVGNLGLLRGPVLEVALSLPVFTGLFALLFKNTSRMSSSAGAMCGWARVSRPCCSQ